MLNLQSPLILHHNIAIKIAVSVFYLLQLLVLGVPILVIARENTNAYFIVISLILFLMSFGTTLLIFIPKIIALKKKSRELASLMVAAAASDFGSRRQSNRGHALHRETSVQQIRRRIEERASTMTLDLPALQEDVTNNETISKENDASKYTERDKE